MQARPVGSIGAGRGGGGGNCPSLRVLHYQLALANLQAHLRIIKLHSTAISTKVGVVTKGPGIFFAAAPLAEIASYGPGMYAHTGLQKGLKLTGYPEISKSCERRYS